MMPKRWSSIYPASFQCTEKDNGAIDDGWRVSASLSVEAAKGTPLSAGIFADARSD
jgi:hypothetical protein